MLEKEKLKGDDAENDNFDDAEINEILARDENEMETFEKLDMDRAREDTVRGTPRLMEEDEVPEVLKEDMSQHVDVREEASGRRVTKKVIYDDGLTEEQWLQAMHGRRE